MLKPVLDLFVGPLKKLPGFPFIFILVSSLYLVGFDRVEFSLDTGVGALSLLAAWSIYRLASYLDKPLYDSLFGPDSKQVTGLKRCHRNLGHLRDKAIRKFFQEQVQNYEQAREHRLIAKKGDKDLPTFYKCCRTLLAGTTVWDDQIAVLLEISKTARSLIILLPVVGLMLAFSNSDESSQLAQRLVFLGPSWVWFAGGIVAIPVFLTTRYVHHCRLYEAVIQRVTHIALADGRTTATFADDNLIVR